MSVHIDARAARSAAPGTRPRPRLPRTAWWAAAPLAAALAAAFAVAAPALAAQPGVTQVSADPYTPATAPTGEHATEVEPDTFAFGSTLVSAFQTGRVFNGGATDIGWAASSDGGASWTHGFLPGTSREAMRPGPFFSVSDPSVAYDARDRTWIISWLGAHFSGGGIVDVMVSRSTDGGLTWGTPVTMAATGVFYDKNWTACDNTPASPFYGHCYTEFDNASRRDLELMSTSADGGLSWGTPTPTADNIHGLGGQPVVQPNGRVVVPFEGFGGIRAFSSDDGGATWNASVQISTRRFEPGGTANDIVLSSSADGTTWSPVSRIPLDPVGSNVDHFIPGLAVNHTSAGASTQLALTYYFDTNPSCSGSTCQIQVGFASSLDNGQTWSAPQTLSDPMQIGWLAPTTQGAMVGDYISTSFLAGQQRVVGAFAIGFAPSPDGLLSEPMYTGLEEVRGGASSTRHDPVLFTGAAAVPSTPF